MTFRLPLQIFRKIFKCKPTTTFPIVRGYSNVLSYSKALTRIVNNTSSLNKLLFQQNRFKTNNEANRKNVRQISKCDEKKNKKKLAFRNTSREDCLACVDPITVPFKDPKLKRLKAAYDASQLKWDHKCEQDICADTQRMDDIRGCKIERKTLPKLEVNNCEPCLSFVPTKAPKLLPIKWNYDQSKLEQSRNCYVPECNVDPPRMDDVRGHKVTPKKLPVHKPSNECAPCLPDKPTIAPKLVRLKPQYDASEMEQKRNCYEPKCNEDPPRMDDVRGHKVTPKKLPVLKPSNECAPCLPDKPTVAPKLVRLKPQNDASEMEQKRNCYEPKCNEDPPRMDDIRGYKITQKSLPKIMVDECECCIPFAPTKAPKLKRPKKTYDDSKLKWKHYCPVVPCVESPRRMDDIMGLKVVRKNLPPLKVSNVSVTPESITPTKASKLQPKIENISDDKVSPKKLPVRKSTNECVPCLSDKPTVAPKLVRLKPQYDASKIEQKRNCYEPKCNVDPPRMDDVRGYKVTPKKLPVHKPSNECAPCLPDKPTIAPKLVRLKPQYDASEMEQKRNCYEPKCNEDPPRMDDVRGHKVTSKKLPVLKPSNECTPCLPDKPTVAPKLVRLKPRNDASDMEQKRNCYEPKCNEDPPRMDDVVGLKVTPKKLPTLLTNECDECLQFAPTYCPELKPPVPKYDASKMKWNHPVCKDFCEDAERIDDLRGYKITRKNLPKLLPANGNCSKCAPKLKRPKLQYDPYLLDRKNVPPKDTCNLDPPRMDDVRCWKPKRKILPSFTSCDRPRLYSTKTCKNASYSIFSSYKYSKLSPQPRKYSKKCKVSTHKIPTCKVPRPNPCLPRCHKFRLKECKIPCKKTKASYCAYSDCPTTLDRNCVAPKDICDFDPFKMNNVCYWKSKILPSFTSCDRPRFYSTSTCKNASYSIYGSNNYSKLSPHHRGYSKKCKAPTCKVPKPNSCASRCQKFRLKECKAAAREVCEDYWEKPCKKTEAPYSAYSDCPGTCLYEDEHSECENTYQVMLQPQKQVSRGFYKLKPTPPPWHQVDPSLDRKCLSQLKSDPCDLDKKDNWQNPCPSMSVAPCKKRYRRHCNEPRWNNKCKKLEAPYKSFSERCPQFPEVEFTECNANEKCFQSEMVLNGIPCYKDYMVHYTASGKEEKKKPDCVEKPKKPTIKCNRTGPGVLEPKLKRTECGEEKCKKKEILPDCPKQKSGGCSKPKNSKKCKPNSNNKITMVELSPNDDKKRVYMCKPIEELSSSKASIEGPSDIKKMVCVYKFMETSKASRKCSSKSSICCKPKKVSLTINPAKAKCIPKCVFSKTKSISSGYKVSDTNLEQSCNPQPPQVSPPPLDILPCSVEVPAANTMWEKICAYFKARPGCPSAAQFRQRELENEARRAAARAGLQIADSPIKFITITLPQSEDNLILKKKLKPKCRMQQKEYPKNKSSCSVPNQPNKTVIPKCKSPEKKKCSLFDIIKMKSQQSIKENNDKACKSNPCGSKKNKKGKIRQPISGNRKKNKKKNTRPECGNSSTKTKCSKNGDKSADCKMYSTYPSTAKKITKLVPLKRQYKQPGLSIISKKTYFTTTTLHCYKRNKGKDSIKYNDNMYIHSKAYLRLNNNYIGKMCMIKLSKIGVKNGLLKTSMKHVDEEPYTICHSCKLLPKHEIFCRETIGNNNNMKQSSSSS